MTDIPLSTLQKGQRALISAFEGDAQRLRALGFMEGDEVSIDHKAWGGDPIAVCLNRHRLIAMRRKDASRISVELA